MNRTLGTLILLVEFSASIASYAKELATVSNHPFNRVEIAYAHNQCSYQYSLVDFCDERHVSKINDAIIHSAANFNRHYILLKIREWKPSEYYGDSLVAIDTVTGIVYPLPFDYYSGKINMNN